MNGMRILIAYDGSPSAGTAVDLVSVLRVPKDSTVRLVEALERTPVLAGIGAPIAGAAESRVAARAAGLRRHGFDVDYTIAREPDAATAILREAEAMEADLIVTGHRGHNSLSTIFLGSVARDVVENATCAVLVARRDRRARVVLAEDASEGAYRARRAVAAWPIFDGRRVDVLSVTHVDHPIRSGVTAALWMDVQQDVAARERDAREAHRRLAVDAAEELRIAGRYAVGHERVGDPAEAIVTFARESDADLVVLGTRARGPVARALLGSVTRAVLLAASCSVLVVR